MTNILLVDDQTIVLQGIAKLLEVSGKVNICAMLDSGEACLEYLGSNPPPDIILLDIHMPGMKGLDVLKNINKTYDVPVIFLTTFDDEYLCQQAAELGAKGLLKKSIGLEELLLSVMKVAAGGHLFPTITSKNINHITPQEELIAHSLVQGKTNKEIAETHHLSPGTVRNYASNLFGKLGVRNRSEAVVKLKERGFF
ncbi:MAG: response regulator transcription factor [Oleibacter sp.]|nr:response regulator transcription factor [Thalassolituus sp.]